MNHFKNRTGGFTLIELLVVISIVAVLSAVVLSSLNTARAKGRDAFRLQQIAQVSKALALYYSANGSYPNITSSNSTDVPARWQQMMALLDASDYIKVDFSIIRLIQDYAFNIIKTVYAVHYYKSSIQDPIYINTMGGDWYSSYGYGAINNGAGYILRVKLEDVNNPALKSSVDTFSLYPGLSGSCVRTEGYYCLVSR